MISGNLFKRSVQARNSAGVSLVEIMLVVGIITILAGIAAPIQNTLLASYYLSDGTADLQTAIRSANLQARLASGGQAAGVWIGKNENGEPDVIVYRGPNYEERLKSLDLPLPISSNVTLEVNPDPDINFHMLTGLSDHDTIIYISNAAGRKTLTVNAAGAVIVKKGIEEIPEQ